MLSFIPLDVLVEIWDLIESVSEGFLTYSFIKKQNNLKEENLQKEIKLLEEEEVLDIDKN